MAPDPSDLQPETNTPPLEIERTFLLDQLPAIPKGAVVYRIEQGYLPQRDQATAADNALGAEVTEGRLRRITRPDGSIVYTHTIKHGEGLVRRETERTITPQQFEEHWPRTAGRRLAKMRYRIAEGGLVWEIDVFDEIDLVLADVEMPCAEAKVTIPDWLKQRVVRDVTDEPAYRNYDLALRISRRR